MKRLLAILTLAIATCFPALTVDADVHVGGYSRSIDTYEQPHYRSNLDDDLRSDWHTYPAATPSAVLPVLAGRGIGDLNGLVGAGIGIAIGFVMMMVRSDKPRESDRPGGSEDD